MVDLLNADGLQTKTLNEIVTDLENGFRNIYGADINLDQNSPDGQMINIFAQALVDLRELMTQIYNSFDPDRAVGRSLDERVPINNIKRRGGSFTILAIDITVDETVELQGLDAAFNSVDGTGYTVQDNAGNQFILIDSVTLTTGTTSLNFRAKQIGLVETTVDTIQTPVTIVLGVTEINNPTGPLELGENQETDAELRLRRQRSVAIASTGYLNGVLAAVLDLDGVTDAKIYENVTNVVDADGIPAHGTWLIVEGGANTDIANVIYAKKSYGSNMKGAVEVDITTASGATFTAKFDRPVAEDLYIRFNIQPYSVDAEFDLPTIKQYLVDNLDYEIGEFAETSEITAKAREILVTMGNEGAAVDVEISDDGVTWVDYLETPTLGSQWVLDTTRIDITEL